MTPRDARTPFNEESCWLVEELRPNVVSFHFGTPSARLLDRVRDAGCFVLSSATSVAEAQCADDFSPLWAGQSVALQSGFTDAGTLTLRLAEDAARRLADLVDVDG